MNPRDLAAIVKLGDAQARQDRLVQDLVTGWDRETIYALLQAVEGWSAVLSHVDRTFPDPHKRAAAYRLDQAAALLRRANVARQWIKEKNDAEREDPRS